MERRAAVERFVGAVAQLGERLNGIQEVRGSIPLGSTAVGYQSGQMEQTVNLPAYAYVGSNPTPTMLAISYRLSVARWRGDAGEVRFLRAVSSVG